MTLTLALGDPNADSYNINASICRSDEEFMAESGMSKDDPIIKELMDSKPSLDNPKGGPNNVHSEKDNSLEKVYSNKTFLSFKYISFWI